MPQPQGLPTPLPDELAKLGNSLAQDVNRAGGRLLLVGGCVRDTFLNSTSSEIDCEVQGLSLSQLKSSLSPKYQCIEVGKAFGVLKLRGLPAELSLPRTENKTGTGHKGFSIKVDPLLPFERSCQRRDFTINAIGYDPLSGELLDPIGGVPDAQNRILRHIGPAFSEDPLRVLRGMQFVARFDLSELQRPLNFAGLYPLKTSHRKGSLRSGKN